MESESQFHSRSISFGICIHRKQNVLADSAYCCLARNVFHGFKRFSVTVVRRDHFSLQVNSPRSRTVIVVKNLPAGTEASVIEKLFQEHGTVARSLLPPSGITALVEMVDPSEAKRAFRALAYSRVGIRALRCCFKMWRSRTQFSS